MSKKKEKEGTEIVFDEVAADLGEPEPNVAFVGKVDKWDAEKNKFVKVAGEPFKGYNTATKHVTLPPVDEQLKPGGFYFEGAAELVRLFPHLYKPVKAKGE